MYILKEQRSDCGVYFEASCVLTSLICSFIIEGAYEGALFILPLYLLECMRLLSRTITSAMEILNLAEAQIKESAACLGCRVFIFIFVNFSVNMLSVYLIRGLRYREESFYTPEEHFV